MWQFYRVSHNSSLLKARALAAITAHEISWGPMKPAMGGASLWHQSLTPINDSDYFKSNYSSTHRFQGLWSLALTTLATVHMLCWWDNRRSGDTTQLDQQTHKTALTHGVTPIPTVIGWERKRDLKHRSLMGVSHQSHSTPNPPPPKHLLVSFRKTVSGGFLTGLKASELTEAVELNCLKLEPFYATDWTLFDSYITTVQLQ